MVKEYLQLPLYILFHPLAGFYDMKYEKKGNRSIIFINLFLFWISFTFRKQYTGIVMNENNPMAFNAFRDLVAVLVVFILWCVANWSVTTLMDGEGKLVDIAMATAYSLTPMILTFIPASIISNVLIDTEAAFYFLAVDIAVAWSAILLFTGILSVHDYSVTKTVGTIILTFASILIILFLMLLVFSLGQQVWIFIRSVFFELQYRT